MKKLVYILFLFPLSILGQTTGNCYSISDFISELSSLNPSIEVDLQEGWNLIGSPCYESLETIEAFASYSDKIIIVKDNVGMVYLPEFNFNNIDSLRAGIGYQLKLSDSIDNFSLCTNIENIPVIEGCTSCLAYNFNIMATVDDDSCEFPEGTFDCNYIDFKYFDEEQYLGEMSNYYMLIGVDTLYSDSEVQSLISTSEHFDQGYEYAIYNNPMYKFKEVPIKFNSFKTCEEVTDIISELEQDSLIAYAHYAMQTENCTDVIGEPIGDLCINSYSSSFYVKVFNENILSSLNNMIDSTNTELVGQVQFMPAWFTLRATKTSNGDALDMANFFFETGLFQYSEPQITNYPVE